MNSEAPAGQAAPQTAPPPDWELLRRRAAAYGVALTDEQVGQLEQYLTALCQWNEKFNLTAIRDPQEMLVKHFLDSLSCALAVDFSRRETLIDVGTGAGFPGMVLKIAYPHLRVTLLDAVQKRLGFLEHLARELSLEGVSTVHARAEDAGRGAGRRAAAPGVPLLRERFDLVTARAVAPLRVLCEWTLPLARPGGLVLAMKGPNPADEVAEAGPAIRILGGGPAECREFPLEGTDLSRSLVVVPKVRPTPGGYPRLPGTARKAPL